MPDALTAINIRRTPQNQKADERQVKNSAGSYTFTVDPMARLRRFLTLGTEAGTYYVGAGELTKDNATVVMDLAKSDGLATVAEIVTISTAGRAPKNNQALFALAVCASVGNDATRKAALAALPQVARTGTHLFQFAQYIEQFRGWGRGLRAGVAKWYEDMDSDKLAYQVTKYQSREGWSHRDLLRLAHPRAVTREHGYLYEHLCGRTDGPMHPQVEVVIKAHESGIDLPVLIKANRSLSWEMLPSEALNDAKVWRALLDNGLPMTALIRQLPRLTRLGLCEPMTVSAAAIAQRLTDADALRKARVHPISILVALRTYASGQSARGDSTWTPSPVILDALDRAFYAAYRAVEPANKRTLLALDVSGSMGSPAAGLPLSCREASAALALVAAATEPMHQIVGFTAGQGTRRGDYGWGMPNAALTPLAISPRQRLDDAIRSVSDLPFGGTYCALPMQWAIDNRKEIDTFVVLTDNETRQGDEHAHQALKRYRATMGIDARLVVVAMAATQFTIADPSDPGMLDISGFDSNTPQLISDFSAGRI